MPGMMKDKVKKMKMKQMRNGKMIKKSAGMKTASGSSRAGESGRKRPMVPDAGKPMQAKPRKPIKKKNSGIPPAMPSGGGLPLGMSGGGKSGKKAKTMKKGKKVKVNKAMGKTLEMRNQNPQVENFQTYVSRMFGGGPTK